MATRASSRRSAGGETTFNRATITFLSVARLKEECEKRGLPTDGNKQALSTRLEDCLDGTYVPPPTPTLTDSSPSTSRNANPTTPKSRPASTPKAASAKRTPRRKNSVGSAGEEESPANPAASPPKKKQRRNSTKKELPSRDCSMPPKEEEIFEEEFSVTIVTVPPAPQFDSDDDQPLSQLASKKVAADAAEPTALIVAPAAEVENEGGDEEKEVRKKKKRRRSKEDDDLESGVVLAKDDSEWVPPEESEKRTTRDSAKKRTRRNTMEVKEEVKEEPEEEGEEMSSSSMPVLDPEIYDKDANEDEEEKQVDQRKASTDTQRKASAGDGWKKAKKESPVGSVVSVERPRSISTHAAPAAAAMVLQKDKRRESGASAAAAAAPRPVKEKPATQKYAELMIAQKKAAEEARAAAAAAAAVNGGSSSSAGTPTATASSTVAKGGDGQEKETSGGDKSPLVTEKIKPDLCGRRDSMGVAGSPSADAATKGFSMTARRNAPPRPVGPPQGGASDLLGDLLGKQQVLLEKKVKSSAETEAEKIRIVSQIKQRAPDLRIREETVNKEKERLQREKQEKERAREERERKERERKLSVINAPSRPIPPPPPLPVVKHDNSPSEQPATEVAAVAATPIDSQPSPQFEPLVEDTDETKALDEVKDESAPEYEPLASAGPSMAPQDRDIALAMRAKRDWDRKRMESKDHGVVAREVPIPGDPFLMRLSDKLFEIHEQQQREEVPIPAEIHECMEDLLKRVETKVDKEMKWERRTKRKSEYQVEREREEEKKRAQMMRDPRALLAKATNILESMHNTGSMDESEAGDSPSTAAATSAASAIHISQDVAEPGTYQDDMEEKPLPEFHGEPVPSDDDEALFLEAAGLPKKERRPKHPVVEEEAPPSHEHILMDYYNACLHIKSATDKPWLIEPDNENGLALMWGGVRTNHGYVLPWREERKCLVFQIKITEHQSIRHIPFMEQEAHDVRVGFSLRASSNIMGESPLSWAFSTTGKKCANNVFQEWGDPCEIGDVVTAVLDFSAKCLSFYKNEACMGVAFCDLPLPEDGDAVYAHVCLKNCKVVVNLGDFPEVDGGWIWGRGGAEGDEHDTTIKRDADWVFPEEIGERRERFEMSRLPPSDKALCTLLMMVGLPGVGKSTWVRQYIRDHPDEKWDVISAEGVMAAMKVNGVARGRAHIGRWDMVLGLVAKALQKMVLLAARRRRNYIVDLSNVNKDSRKRRLMHFKDFTKKCIVIVPDEEEMVSRQMHQARQEGSSHVPAEAILEMKAVFTFPTEEAEGFDEVHLVEPAMPRIAEAIEIIQRFNDEGKPWYQKRYRGRGGRRGGG
ncbi:hypothetical protein PENTCL1PPCAC_25584, partial [Pristionchus entomophagus]